MSDLLPILITVLAFVAVAAIVFVLGQQVAATARVQRRAAQQLVSGGHDRPGLIENVDALVSIYFDEKRFNITDTARANLRRDLMRAGYFNSNALRHYIFFRLALVVVVPALTYLFAEQGLIGYGWPFKLGLLGLSVFLAILGPDAYLARRQRILVTKYRATFPDVLDLIVVCVDAGLSLEAALERISAEVMKQNREFGMNLLIMGAETRAGRSMIDALDSFADRLGLDEARSLVAMLRQSIELGSDIAEALRVFSDEMRDRRLLRAEERANQLPVKMVIPLGAFIFPVILLTVMFPVVVRLLTVLR